MASVPPPSGPAGAPRGPRVFDTSDPDVVVTTVDAEPTEPAAPAPDTVEPGLTRRASAGTLMETGFRWGLLLVSALAGAAFFAASLWFARFVSIGFERDDWIGIVIRALLTVAAVAALVLMLREIVGWLRLSRLGRLRRLVGDAIAKKDLPAERKAADRIIALYRGRPELAWSLARVKSHRADVHDPAALLTLVERDLVAGLDTTARRQITGSAKRIATVTALAPMAWISLVYVVFENIRMMRRIAAIYGGRPGVAGALRLARSVIGHLIAAGGVALTDDLLGQFIGQDMLRRLSRRLGEGAFNGALTARIGVATIAEVRPLPFLEAEPVRARAILSEVIRPMAGKPPKP